MFCLILLARDIEEAQRKLNQVMRRVFSWAGRTRIQSGRREEENRVVYRMPFSHGGSNDGGTQDDKNQKNS